MSAFYNDNAGGMRETSAGRIIAVNVAIVKVQTLTLCILRCKGLCCALQIFIRKSICETMQGEFDQYET